MTSSRLPIGVAQTASGTLALAVERLEPDERRRRSGPPRRRARPRRSARARPPGCERLALAAASRAGASSELARGAPKPPPTTTTSGSKTFTSEPIAGAEQRPISAERADRARVAAARARRRGRCASRPGPNSSRADAVGGRPGGDRLEVAVAVAVPLAGRPVGDDDDVAELRPAAVEPAVEDEPAADARAEREHDEVAARRARRRVATRRARPRCRRSRPRPGGRTAPAARPASRTSASGRLTEPSGHARALVDVRAGRR